MSRRFIPAGALGILVTALSVGCGEPYGEEYGGDYVLQETPREEAPAIAVTTTEPTPRCDPSSPFGPPGEALDDQRLGGYSSARFTSDEAIAFYIFSESAQTRQSTPPSRLVAKRRGGPPSSDPFAFTSTARVSSFGITDGREALYAEVSGKIFYSLADGGVFSTLQALALSRPEEGADLAPYVVPHGSALYFVRRRGEDAEEWRLDIMRATLATPSMASDEQVIIASSTMGGLGAPVVTPDERTLFFSGVPGQSDRPVIHSATRRGDAWVFEDPQPIRELDDGSTVRRPTWVSADGCSLVFEEVPAAGTTKEPRIMRTHRGS